MIMLIDRNAPHPYDNLIHTTTLIRTVGSGRETSATGFFFGFYTDSSKKFIRLGLITSKHVIAGKSDYCFDLNSIDLNSDSPQYGKSLTFNGKINEWHNHPEDEIDLAIMPMGEDIADSAVKGKFGYIKCFSPDDILTELELKQRLPVEEILMVGYPVGLIDKTTNIPIVRKGITATPLQLQYERKNEFLTDCASFPGSSGSPVIWKNPSLALGRGAKLFEGEKESALLGVHFNGFSLNENRSIKPIDENKSNGIPNSTLINLGRCVKAEEILKFKDIILNSSDRLPSEFQAFVNKINTKNQT